MIKNKMALYFSNLTMENMTTQLSLQVLKKKTFNLGFYAYPNYQPSTEAE